jgi:hypothetical protein
VCHCRLINGEPTLSVLTKLFRPVGRTEFELIRASGFREFPPRLPEQPYFYPVLNLEYATQIARDWNAKDAQSGSVGYVLKFQVESEFLNRYQVRQVGDVTHREYWIPAEDLVAFNERMVGLIEVVAEYRGEPA